MLPAGEAIFWASIGILVYTYLGYPLLLAIVSPLFRRRSPEPGYTPSLTILIAAYNEEAGIRAKIERTLALVYPREKLEILVLSDGSTDRTDEIVRSISDPGVRLLRVEGRKGKKKAQNEGVLQARGEILVFSDTTTIYHSQALLYLACNYSDRHVGAVSGRYQYFYSHCNSPTGLGTVAFWNYENFVKFMQSRIRE